MIDNILRLSISFIGIFGLRDSLRDNVDKAVIKCHNAGVTVIMVTGDNLITASAIASECNIFPAKIKLDNLRPQDVESDPNKMTNPETRGDYIKELLKYRPHSMTGNSFYTAIGGIFCSVYHVHAQNPKQKLRKFTKKQK